MCSNDCLFTNQESGWDGAYFYASLLCPKRHYKGKPWAYADKAVPMLMKKYAMNITAANRNLK
jgi:hypothetical protein